MFDAGDLEDYTCSTYLNDLNRHKQLALEQWIQVWESEECCLILLVQKDC